MAARLVVDNADAFVIIIMIRQLRQRHPVGDRHPMKSFIREVRPIHIPIRTICIVPQNCHPIPPLPKIVLIRTHAQIIFPVHRLFFGSNRNPVRH